VFVVELAVLKITYETILQLNLSVIKTNVNLSSGVDLNVNELRFEKIKLKIGLWQQHQVFVVEFMVYDAVSIQGGKSVRN
jgi:hypothetical protein